MSIVPIAFIIACAPPGENGAEPTTVDTTQTVSDTVQVTKFITISEINNIKMQIDPGAWEEATEMRQQVTPIKVRITNDTTIPLLVRYNAFALIGEDGTYYAALPLYRIEGTQANPQITGNYSPVTAPTFEYENFNVAPYYSGIYPNIDPFTGRVFHDPLYYDAYTDYWSDIQLPTLEMLKRAIPEGILNEAGTITGYFFFEKVDPEGGKVQYTAELINAQNGTIFGRINIPFELGQTDTVDQTDTLNVDTAQ